MTFTKKIGVDTELPRGHPFIQSEASIQHLVRCEGENISGAIAWVGRFARYI